MKRILVPIDFSLYAENAFLSAVAIAAISDARVTCVNVVNSKLDWKKLPTKERLKYQETIDLESEANEKLKAFVMDHNITSVPIEIVVGVGTPSEVIIETANQQLTDLIVIGAYGRGHHEGRFIGSNLQRVIRWASCPVFAVKKAIKSEDLHQMAYASLFNEVSQPAFNKMRPLIKITGATVHFLFINVPSLYRDVEKAQKQMENYALGQEDLSIYKHVYDHAEAEKGIIAFCEENNMGWIGIASNTRKSSSSYQIGVTETVIFKTDIPVLSVKFQ
jgi:nucleotide-binding universal stress UspA family protein